MIISQTSRRVHGEQVEAPSVVMNPKVPAYAPGTTANGASSHASVGWPDAAVAPIPSTVAAAVIKEARNRLAVRFIARTPVPS
jgi:hypothetical protein